MQADTGIQVTVGMVKKTWGTELAVDGRSLPQNGKLSLWVKDRAGAEDRACAWMATPSGRVRVTSATPVQYASIASVELRNDRQQTIAVIAVPGAGEPRTARTAGAGGRSRRPGLHLGQPRPHHHVDAVADEPSAHGRQNVDAERLVAQCPESAVEAGGFFRVGRDGGDDDQQARHEEGHALGRVARRCPAP